jgi:hypothetical protein
MSDELKGGSQVSRCLQLNRRKLLSSCAAFGIVALGSSAAVLVEGLSGSAKAQDEGGETEEPTYNVTPGTSSEFSYQYNFNTSWVSSLDLRFQDRLLDTLGPYVDDPYFPYSTSGVPVLMANGDPVPDTYSVTKMLMSPTSDVGPVVTAGRLFGLAVGEAFGRSPIFGVEAFVLGLGAYFVHGGIFDYQRRGFPGFTTFYPEFRDVSNFNIGVFAQQAGISETTISRIAGAFAVVRGATNAQRIGWDPQNWMPTQNRRMIHLGYSLGARGAFTQSNLAPLAPL